jgi:hypothetical protein
VASAVVLLLIPVAVLEGGSRFRDFLDFGAGVLSLVCLTCSVIWGLVAQDRILLSTRQRIVGQAVHRTTAVASIAFLLLHITVKIALNHTRLIAAVVPFALGVRGSAGLIGLGSAAGLLMIFVGVTGALRGNFAGPAPVAARWRAMHMLAYPAWCAALVHGLYAGRQAKPVYVVLYCLSLFGVMAVLALRSAPRPVKRRVTDGVVRLLGGAERPEAAGGDARRARAAKSALPPNARAARQPTHAGTTGSLPRVPSPFSPPYGAPAGAMPPYGTPVAATGQESSAGFAAAYRAVAPPRAESSGSRPGSWPVPSPPPVGEAPRSVHDTLDDTGHDIPAHDDPDRAAYGTHDLYHTGETNPLHGAYTAHDTYVSGPTTESNPGAPFDGPGSGESWNMPSGGFR